VKLAPIGAGDVPISTMSIDKIVPWRSARHQCWADAGSGIEGSAGYVAMERITGTLGGRKGSFTLQHSGLMEKGAQSLTVVVVPDSGTEGLSGLTGMMNIIVTAGKHDYQFRYMLPV
jgi:hypothetical protein